MNENEVAMFMVFVGAFVVLLMGHKEFRKIPNYALLASSFYCFFAASAFTNLEHILWHDLLHILEHVSYLLSSTCLCAWCFLSLCLKRGVKE